MQILRFFQHLRQFKNFAASAHYGDSRMQEKKMMEILEELAEEENN